VTTTTPAETSDDVYYDPYDREILADPYPYFRRLRDHAPLYHNETYDFWAVSRFDDVEAVLVDKARFLNRHGTILDMVQAKIDFPPGTLIMEDGPVHGIHRQLLSRVFTPKAMLAIEPKVREFCAGRLAELAERDSFDMVTDFAQYVPMRVFGMLLGLPEEDQERVRAHVEEHINAVPGERQQYGDADHLGAAFYEEFVDHRYAHPGDDLITRLITTEFDDEHGVRRTLTRDEALMYLVIIAGAGNHTTNRLIGWTAKVLADHPDARREIHHDRSLIPNAIEEILRFESSSTQAARYVGTDVEMYGQTIPAGSAFLCLIGSANRDEREFADPDRFDIHRQIGHHLTFAYGAHFCLGAALARLEGRVALDELLERFPEWDVDLDRAQLGSSPGVRGYASLPVHIR
jgi:cytochrome P450